MSAVDPHVRHIRKSSPSLAATELPPTAPTTAPLTTQNGNISLSPSFDKDLYARRRSVDVGGLALALGGIPLGDEGTGKGWGGWEEEENGEASFAELLSNMFMQIQSIISIPVLSPPPSVTAAARQGLIRSLDSWNFEPHKLPDEEVLASTQIIFEALFRIRGMQEQINVSLEQLNSFLRHLRQVYRSLNTYHNFQHALDVFQATHAFLRAAGVVPPVSILLGDSRATWEADEAVRNSLAALLSKEDLFALYIAAVGHDVGHPGFNNIFMKNAGAPLSQVYDHKSALEQMHCAFLIPIMKQHGLGHLLEKGKGGTPFRKLLFETVLATDMGVHHQFMQRFTKLVDDPDSYDLSQTRLLLCQALIKCADISNPSRPHAVSQHWSAALNAEWANQALLERHLQLPISVQDSTDPVDEAKGQIYFIQEFALPLLEITTAAIPEMRSFTEQCVSNCQLWTARLAELTSRSQPNYPPVPYRSLSPPQPHDYISVLPSSLPAEFLPLEHRVAPRTEVGSYHNLPQSTNATSTATPSVGSRSTSPILNEPMPGDAAPHRSYPTITTQSLGPNSSPVFSPTESQSSPTSPRSDSLPRTPGAVVSPPLSSIRAAYRDSVRQKKSFHRSSWTGSSTSLTSFSFASSPLTPTSATHHRSPTTPASATSVGDTHAGRPPGPAHSLSSKGERTPVVVGADLSKSVPTPTAVATP